MYQFFNLPIVATVIAFFVHLVIKYYYQRFFKTIIVLMIFISKIFDGLFQDEFINNYSEKFKN